jgi:phage terminase large subunit-like protein
MTTTRARRRRRPLKAVPPRLPADPVTRYAQAVIAGRVVACRAVRQAAERHVRDLGRQRTAAFPYWFSPSAAQHVIDFFPQFLTLEDGTPFELTPWMQFAFGSIFGWRRVEDDGRRIQRAYICTGKGSGKTPGLAGIGLYGVGFDGEQSAEVYAAGFDRGQGDYLVRDAIRMAEDSPALAEVLEVGKHNIAHVDSGSFFRAVSSEHRSKSGPRPSLVLIEELHEHRDGTVVNKMQAGFKGRVQPLMIEITNTGDDRTSICWQHHEHSLQVLEQVLVDEEWFAFVCHLDPCAACYADGYREPRDGCLRCDDWTNPAVWPKTNPALEQGLPRLQYLQTQVNQAVAMPNDQALVKRLNFCCWTHAHRLWIPPDRWDACRVASVAETNENHACAAGFDMSEKLDLTSGVILLRVDQPEDAPTDDITITDVVDGKEVARTLNLNFYIDLIPFFWLPEETLIERVKTERIPYDVWRSGGHLQVTPGPVIDHDLIYERFTKDIGPRYRPQRVGYDAHNATQFAVALRDKGKFTIVDVPQGRKLSESFKLFEALVRLRRIRHTGNPVMGFCVANAEPKRDRYENLWIEKPSLTKRVDGLIAAVIALNQLVLLPAQRRKRKGALVYTKTGFVPARPPAGQPGDQPTQ